MDPFNTPTSNRYGMFAASTTTSSHSNVPQTISMQSGSSGNGVGGQTPVSQFPSTFGHSPLLGATLEAGSLLGFTGDGTIHLSCLAAAPSELLMRSQNPAYITAMQKIEVLNQQIRHLQGELAGQKEAFNGMIAKIPILLGIPDAQTPVNLNSSVQLHNSATRNVVLGHGMDYPTAPAAPPHGVTLKYWSKGTYSSRTNAGGSKTGQHKSDKNVGQRWIEDASGHPITGYVAQSIRETLASCFHSLVWTGQAQLQSRELGHEARVYIHNVLARNFPFLLNCEGGRWKINELIIQGYSGFVGTHINKKATKQTSANTESAERTLSQELESGSSTKRPRSQSTASDSEAHRAKAPREASCEMRLSPSPAPLPSPSLPSSNSFPHALLDPGIGLYTLDDSQRGGTPAVSSSVPLASGSGIVRSTRAGPDEGVDSNVGNHDPDSGSSRHPVPAPSHALEVEIANVGAPNMRTSDGLPHVNLSVVPAPPTVTYLPQLPVPKPFTITTRRNSAQHVPTQADQPSLPIISSQPQAGPADNLSSTIPQPTTNLISPPTADTESLPPADAISPPPANTLPPPLDDSARPPLPDDALPRPRATSASPPPPVHVPSTLPASQSADTAAPNPDDTPSQHDRRRRGTGKAVKASDKYNPDTISIQSFHMRDRIKENSQILLTECQTLFAGLSSERRKEYQDEVTLAKRQKKENLNMTKDRSS